MTWLVDTNILVQLASRKAVRYALVRGSVSELRREGHSLRVSAQNLIEFWNVATRPRENNGLGLGTSTTAQAVRLFERFFPMLPDAPTVYQEWRRLVVQYQVQGVQAHDARLVAVMKINQVSHILTFNSSDFQRYEREGIVPISPTTIVT